MTKRTRRNHAPAFKAKVAWPPRRGRRRWPNWRSFMTLTRTRSPLGRRNGRKVPPGYSAGQRRPKRHRWWI